MVTFNFSTATQKPLKPMTSFRLNLKQLLRQVFLFIVYYCLPCANNMQAFEMRSDRAGKWKSRNNDNGTTKKLCFLTMQGGAASYTRAVFPFFIFEIVAANKTKKFFHKQPEGTVGAVQRRWTVEEEERQGTANGQ